MPPRRRLATGIYLDAYGITAVYYIHGERHEKRFPATRPVEDVARWRRHELLRETDRAPRDPRGSLARDVVTFLKTRKGLANYKAEKVNLKAWIRALDNPRRWTITAQQIHETIATWRAAGYSEQTLRHRARILRQLFQTLDGRRVASPFDDVPLPKKPRPRPVSVSETLVQRVAHELYKHEVAGYLKDSKTRARYLVIATTGHRPAEVKRAQPSDVDLERRLWFVRTAKGGVSTVQHLNDEMLEAWKLFTHAGAWGAFDTRSLSRVLHGCGWPRNVRPYNLRHTIGMALSERGADLGDIQAHMGHASVETTRTYYVPAIDSRRAAVSELVDNRLGALAFRPTPPTKVRRGTEGERRRKSGKKDGPK